MKISIFHFRVCPFIISAAMTFGAATAPPPPPAPAVATTRIVSETRGASRLAREGGGARA